MGYANDDFGFRKCCAFVNFADEMFDHFFGHVKIRYNPVTHRAYGLDRTGCTAQHQFSVLAKSQSFFLTVFDLIGHNRRLIQNNALASDINQSIRSTQVYRHI